MCAKHALQKPRLVVLPGMDGTDLMLNQFKDKLTTAQDPNRVIAATYPPDEKLTVHQLAHHITTNYLTPLAHETRGYVLVNQSFSGHVALQLARRKQPGKLKGHVFVNTFVQPPGPSWLGALQIPDVAFRAKPPSWLVSPVFLGRGGTGMDIVQNAGLAVSADVMNHRLAICLSEDSSHLWRRKDILPPNCTLYLRGTDDWIVNDVAVEKLRRQRSDIQWVDIKHGPHLLLQRYGEQCAIAVDQFCAKLCAEA